MITHSPDQAFLCADEAVLFFRDGVSYPVRYAMFSRRKISRAFTAWRLKSTQEEPGRRGVCLVPSGIGVAWIYFLS